MLIKKFILLLSFLTIFSCTSNDKNPKIRIVDLQGKPKAVLTKVPDFNAKILDGQDSVQPVNLSLGGASQEQQATTIIPEAPAKNYSNSATKQVFDTLQAPALNKNISDNSKNNMVFAGRQNEKTVAEYDLANSRDDEYLPQSNSTKNDKKKNVVKEIFEEKKPSITATEVEKKSSDNDKSVGKKYYVQTGSYASKEVALDELASMKKFHKGKIEEVETSEKTMHRVLLGPFVNKNQARKLVTKIVNSGHEAILVKSK